MLPSNEGRGYVLRRIMRRAMRHAQLLGAKDPLMYRLVPALVREMGQAYPELIRAEPLITETLKLEETRFRKTLERGLSILDEETRALTRGQNLSGEMAFTLYDTFGFPLDLTQDALKARGIGVDTEAFKAAMERQRQMARAAWSGSGEAATETVWFGIKERVGATEFLGYDTETAEGVVVALLKDGKEVERTEGRRDRPRGPQPDAVLRRIRRPDRRYRHPAGRGRAGSRDRHARRSSATFSSIMALVEHGSLKIDQSLELDGRSRAPLRHSRQPFGDASSARGPAPGARRPRGAKGLARRAGSPALRLQPSQAHRATRSWRASRISPTGSLLQNEPVVTKTHGASRRPSNPARARCSARNTATRCASCRWARPSGNKTFSIELCGGTHVNRTGDIGLVTIVAEAPLRRAFAVSRR